MTMFDYKLPSRRSGLRRHIIFINALVFAFLTAGVITVQSSHEGLVDERLTGIEEQARIVAGTLAEYARNTDTRSLKISDAAPLLRDFLAPTRLRARLYDTDGKLVIDTRNLLARNIVQTVPLPPIDDWSRFEATVGRLYDGVIGVRPFAKLDPYFEAGEDGRVYHEVGTALQGEEATAERVDEQNKLVLSVAVPVQRFKAIYGVLFVSTEGGDIDDILRQERAKLIMYIALALAVMIGSSLYLSGTVADPLRKLAAAAERVRRQRGGRETVPDIDRNDEIGELSQNFSAMTRALYDRIDAIESFAADVAHELKNPLTSLKSAVEMFSRAADDEARTRLMNIIRADVKRIDRLITDISDASRLDAELSRETSEPVDIARLLEGIAEAYGLMELPRGVKLALDLRLPPEAIVIGRNERVGQVVRNLVDNAVSFSPAGGTVTVSAWVEGTRLRFAVEDEGPGIPPDNLETVFGRFYTERPSDHDFGKNSGLGLSIARQIVTGVYGRIWAENREQGGARFVVELPWAR
ncbi:MAG: stimulus-sensing domain-containing protein [Alphaproteobacteria bacterium]|nr:stimulus-sensing domain-containing protein [Alphaproteobacteria bacterium]MDE2630430.1 stimulus-sensing domain-containing protein [Alphaproteobacteria bacterium]